MTKIILNMLVKFESRQVVTKLDTTDRKKVAYNTVFASGDMINNTWIKYLIFRPNAKPENVNGYAKTTQTEKIDTKNEQTSSLFSKIKRVANPHTSRRTVAPHLILQNRTADNY